MIKMERNFGGENGGHDAQSDIMDNLREDRGYSRERDRDKDRKRRKRGKKLQTTSQ